jgi:nitric oxide reductase NorQ protein
MIYVAPGQAIRDETNSEDEPMKVCRMCGVDKSLTEFTAKSSSNDGLSAECRKCQKEYRENRAKLLATGAVAPRQRVSTLRSSATSQLSGAPIVKAYTIPAAASAPVPEEPTMEEKVESLKVIDPEGVKNLKPGDFIQSAEVLATWVAVQKIAKSGQHAPNLLFKGPSGSGKTEAAKDLAKRSDLPFYKVDASSMVDPEAWFGTREVVVEDGAPRTVYIESGFVEHIQCPGVLLIDEINRVADAVRNNLIPLFDDSRQVTNPLTGQIVKRHPLCFVIMTANIGIAFTGTYAIDPALLTRALTTNFAYLAPDDEIAVVAARTGLTKSVAGTLVRFASDTRKKAATDDDFLPVSTREVLAAAGLVAQGLDMTTAVRQAVINSASEEGGAESQRAQLEYLWKGIYKDNGPSAATVTTVAA